MSASLDFAAMLRSWRRRRALSHLELARRAEVSQRHLSFLELGRAAPSRAMVLRLAAALEVPLRQQNALLLAAGFAPVWRESELAAPELAAVGSASTTCSASRSPSRRSKSIAAGISCRRTRGRCGWSSSSSGRSFPGAPVNLADALVGPDLLRPFLVNWAEVVGYFVRTVEADAAADGTAATAALLERMLAYAGVDWAMKRMPSEPAGRVLPMRFRKGEVALSLFTTVATLGTPQDVTLQELRIERFFPLDEPTAAAFRSWAAGQAERWPAPDR